MENVKSEEKKMVEEKEIVRLEGRAGEEVSLGALGRKEAGPGHGFLDYSQRAP